ncbi:MAG TPA: ABC transporter permease subunit [Gammaproteobacteria bacterium]|nr:ABC transporter permease subunit [Gammaproteobacteria bacterium]
MKTAPANLAGSPRRRIREIKDLVARHAVTVGGLGVIAAILLIFFYLLSVVLPIFRPAEVESAAVFAAPGTGDTGFMIVEERGEYAGRLGSDGKYVFFRTADGEVVHTLTLPLPDGVSVTAVSAADVAQDRYVLGLSDGSVLPVAIEYDVNYGEQGRTLAPVFEFPLGETPIDTGVDAPISLLAGQLGEDRAVFALVQEGALRLLRMEMQTSFLTGETTLSEPEILALGTRFTRREPVAHLLIDPLADWLYVASPSGELLMFAIDQEEPLLNQRLQLGTQDDRLTTLVFLNGGISLLAGYGDGRIEQWFPVRDADNRYTIAMVRDFSRTGSAVTTITPEHRRKGFVAGFADGRIGIYYATSERRLVLERASDVAIAQLAISPRANHLAALDANGRLVNWKVENEHPEVSWSSLWGKVWYESYPEPDYVWQSSAATNDFEPKFSLVPLSVGTLKAAFYAMLVAVPLALFGAIYTACFMAPRLRRSVKPVLEVMEALPTVILGFLAGLWLAPFVESNLPGLFLLLLMMPLAMIACGYAWNRMPRIVRHAIPEGWAPLLLVVPLMLVGWLCFVASQPVEAMFFGGNMPQWISNELGIPHDQRNAIVVGIAMGFAVIPTIFSIAEDALFEVPRHLSYGSLALGATPWQTLVRVVLPTASPGIFSALMIGLGRAVGETMIVLMATGNTPVMNWNLFEGMRTLSANIAVEVPESEVASTHYRVLFLAALVLFLFTFVVNTVAEVVRQRLRRKYSAI